MIPFSGPYTASKYALEGLAESHRYELSGTGIDVVIVEPGGFKTSFLSNMEMAEDDARVASYGALAEISEKMWDGFTETLQGDEAPDAQRVADAILSVIQTPAGKRPLRTVVDPLMGGSAPSAINRTTDEVQAQLQRGLEMDDLAVVKGP